MLCPVPILARPGHRHPSSCPASVRPLLTNLHLPWVPNPAAASGWGAGWGVLGSAAHRLCDPSTLTQSLCLGIPTANMGWHDLHRPFVQPRPAEACRAPRPLPAYRRSSIKPGVAVTTGAPRASRRPHPTPSPRPPIPPDTLPLPPQPPRPLGPGRRLQQPPRPPSRLHHRPRPGTGALRDVVLPTARRPQNIQTHRLPGLCGPNPGEASEARWRTAVPDSRGTCTRTHVHTARRGPTTLPGLGSR